VDTQTEPWGIKVALVAVKDIDLPQDMQRAMAKQAEAERERRAKVIHAQGEFQAAQKLSDAAEIMAKQPAAFHLRFLQALSQIAIEKNETIIVPVPIDLLASLFEQTAETQ
jgi:regulator of protease activity HflC (stomatin/prohibitin superfamily)